jgi:uncharacterized membrane protein YgcG
MISLRNLAVAVAAVAVIGSGAACGSDDARTDNAGPVIIEPAAYGPTVGGQAYCGYRFIPEECFGVVGANGQPLPAVLLPTSPPAFDAVDYALTLALYQHFLTYQPLYDGHWGYSRYERNARRVGTPVVLDRRTYVDNGTRWRETNKAAVEQASKNAPYVTKGANGKPVQVKGDKYATQANTANDVTKAKSNTNGQRAGGNADKVTDPAKAGPNKNSATTEKNVTRTNTGGSSKSTTSGGSSFRSGSTGAGSSGFGRR